MDLVVLVGLGGHGAGGVRTLAAEVATWGRPAWSRDRGTARAEQVQVVELRHHELARVRTAAQDVLGDRATADSVGCRRWDDAGQSERAATRAIQRRIKCRVPFIEFPSCSSCAALPPLLDPAGPIQRNAPIVSGGRGVPVAHIGTTTAHWVTGGETMPRVRVASPTAPRQLAFL